MSRVYPIIKKVTIVQATGDEITRDHDTVNRIEISPEAIELNGLATAVSEALPQIQDEGSAGILVKDSTFHPDTGELVLVTATSIDNAVHPDAADVSAVGTTSLEPHPDPVDVATAITAILNETLPDATDANRLSLVVSETSPNATSSDLLGASVPEVHPLPTSFNLLKLGVGETLPSLTEEVFIRASQTAQEIHPNAIDVPRIGPIVPETIITPLDSQYAKITYTAYGNSVKSNSNWGNPSFAYDRDDNSASVMSATSSGVVPGTTSNTTVGTLVVKPLMADVTDITNIVSATISLRNDAIVASGTPFSGQAVNVSFDFSINNGANWQNLANRVALGSPQIAQGNFQTMTGNLQGAAFWDAISKLEYRAGGTVQSGTGTASNVTVQVRWFYTRLEIIAERIY